MDTETPLPSGRQVILIGEGQDDDGDELSYAWSQISGPAVELLDADSPKASFTTPDENGELVFQLLVNDGKENSLPAEIHILVRNTPPQITSLHITPDPAYTDSELRAEVSVSNRDGRDLSYVYTWMVNGEEVPEADGETLAPKHFTKDDQVQVALQVTDGFNGDADSAQITIADSPPVVTLVGVPKTANYGEPLSFQVLAEDADDDPVGFHFLARPNGMEIDEEGNVTWTPTGPLFVKETEFNWKLEVQAEGLSEITGSAIWVLDADRKPPMSRNGISLSTDLYESIAIGNFGKEGSPEILITDGMKRLFTVGQKGDGYAQTWSYPFALTNGNERIKAIAATQLDPDGAGKWFFLVSIANGSYGQYNHLLSIDGETREIANLALLPQNEWIEAIRVADLNGDGNLELVTIVNILNNRKLEVRNARTLETIWSSATQNLGNSFALGDVNGDGWTDIVTANGYVYGFNGTSYVNKWIYPEGFGSRIGAGDLNGNGRDEIIGISTNDSRIVTIFDATTREALLEHTHSAIITNLAVGDITRNGKSEIITSDYQRVIHAQALYEDPDPRLAEEWAINSPAYYDFRALAIGDVTGNEEPNIVWGGRGNSNYANLVIAGKGNDGETTVLWKNDDDLKQLEGPFVGGEKATIAGESPSLAFASMRTNSTYQPRVIRLEPESSELESSSSLWSSIYNNDFVLSVVESATPGTDEALIATRDATNGYHLSIYDFIQDSTRMISTQINSQTVAIAHGDLNEDGHPEMVVSLSNGKVSAYDIRASTLYFDKDESNASGVDVAVADLDNDGKLEIVAASSNGITVYSEYESEYIEKAHTELTGIRDITIGDMNGDGILEIITATQDYDGSTISVYSAKLAKKSQFRIEDHYVSAMTMETYGPSNSQNLLLGANTHRYCCNVNHHLLVAAPLTGEKIMESPELPGETSKNSLHFVDMNDDGIPEISYGTSHAMNVTR